MLLTEAEASRKWCPHARTARRESAEPGGETVMVVGGTNRDGLGGCIKPHSSRCLGSECMAWRWEKDPDFIEVDEVPRGFCGAFGRPDECPL